MSFDCALRLRNIYSLGTTDARNRVPKLFKINFAPARGDFPSWRINAIYVPKMHALRNMMLCERLNFTLTSSRRYPAVSSDVQWCPDPASSLLDSQPSRRVQSSSHVDRFLFTCFYHTCDRDSFNGILRFDEEHGKLRHFENILARKQTANRRPRRVRQKQDVKRKHSVSRTTVLYVNKRDSRMLRENSILW